MSDTTKGTDQGAAPESPAHPRKFRPLRAWPAVLLVGLMLVLRFGPGYLEGGMSIYWMLAVFGPLICCLLLLIWWVAASRATWKERLFGALGVIAAFMVAAALVDPTMRGPGIIYVTLPMGMVFFLPWARRCCAITARRNGPVWPCSSRWRALAFPPCSAMKG